MRKRFLVLLIIFGLVGCSQGTSLQLEVYNTMVPSYDEMQIGNTTFHLNDQGEIQYAEVNADTHLTSMLRGM